jgi:hypothetical protein
MTNDLYVLNNYQLVASCLSRRQRWPFLGSAWSSFAPRTRTGQQLGQQEQGTCKTNNDKYSNKTIIQIPSIKKAGTPIMILFQDWVELAEEEEYLNSVCTIVIKRIEENAN